MSDLIFNGPITFNMEVLVINDETGIKGKVGIGMGSLEYLTKDSIKERLNEFESNELNGSLDGFRLMTKRESFDFIMMEKTGQTFALPRGEDWDAT